jgi:predicted nucleotidyltransferase component of viral defense system
MNNKIDWDILDKNRKNILPDLKFLKEDFYLGGGTALALQIGHRESIDFDFFSKKKFNQNELLEEFRKKNSPKKIDIVQNKKNTLSLNIKDIEISCFSYNYPLLKSLIETEYLMLASIEDIAAMKLSAITSRATTKDYIDIYYILQKIPLDKLMLIARKKYPEIDTNVIVKSLIYFEDIEEQPIDFKNGKEVSLEKIKAFLEKKVKEYIQTN